MKKNFTINNKIFFCAYILILMLFMYGACLYPDSYYYWEWSRHLQLSYYDGSPLIAYIIYLYTKIFGQHEFSLWLIGLTAATVTAWTIHRITSMLFGDKVASYAMPMWLLTPGVLGYFILQVTYNTPLIVFWGLTLYFFILLSNTRKIIYFYCCGISIGLLLLSKYPGILLCCSLFILCLCYKKYFFILTNKHFYMSMCLAFLICSPILVWNFQHHWASFVYQLRHGYVMKEISHPLLKYIFSTIIDYNAPVFFLFFLGIINYKLLFQEKLAVLTIPTLFVWIFFAMSTADQENWSAPFYFTGVILLAYLISLQRDKRKILLFIFSCIVFSSTLLSAGYRFQSLYLLPDSGWSGIPAMKKMMKNIDDDLYRNTVIFGNNYAILACAHFFLAGNPEVYSMDLRQGRQYYFWWQEKASKPIQTKVTFISLDPFIASQAGTFHHCVLLMHEEYIQHRWIQGDYPWQLYVYRCQLNLDIPLARGNGYSSSN